MNKWSAGKKEQLKLLCLKQQPCDIILNMPIQWVNRSCIWVQLEVVCLTVFCSAKLSNGVKITILNQNFLSLSKPKRRQKNQLRIIKNNHCLTLIFKLSQRGSALFHFLIAYFEKLLLSGWYQLTRWVCIYKSVSVVTDTKSDDNTANSSTGKSIFKKSDPNYSSCN